MKRRKDRIGKDRIQSFKQKMKIEKKQQNPSRKAQGRKFGNMIQCKEYNDLLEVNMHYVKPYPIIYIS